MSFNRVPRMAAVVALSAAGLALAAIEINRFSVDGGGVMRSSAGTFEVLGTIGQPDAGTMRGGNLTLTGGFWFSTPPGDYNEDGGTGLSDVAALPDCMGGPNSASPAGSCLLFDVNRSGRVDLIDFAMIQTVFGGQ